MSSAKLCVSSRNKLTGVCLLLPLFISVYGFKLLFSATAHLRLHGGALSLQLRRSCQSLKTFFFQTSKLINEAADCCGRPFYMWTNGGSRCLDGLRAN